MVPLNRNGDRTMHTHKAKKAQSAPQRKICTIRSRQKAAETKRLYTRSGNVCAGLEESDVIVCPKADAHFPSTYNGEGEGYTHEKTVPSYARESAATP